MSVSMKTRETVFWWGIIFMIISSTIAFVYYNNHSSGRLVEVETIEPNGVDLREVKALLYIAPEDKEEHEKLLVDNAYFEARDLNDEGVEYVTEVAITRVFSTRFPNNLKKVITQGAEGVITLHRCHFSWQCDGLSDIPTNLVALARVREIVKRVLERDVYTFKACGNSSDGYIGGATHYYNPHTVDEPSWAKGRTACLKTSTHHFFKGIDKEIKRKKRKMV